MESQTFEQPPQAVLQQSRPQSDDLNAISRSSRAEGQPSPFLWITLCLGFSSWIVCLISQAILAATIRHGNAAVRLLWFGIVIQFILLVEVFEVFISRSLAYGAQISIFAGLVTVFAVLGVDQNIYSSLSVQIAVGAGWLITAIINLLWIIYFTSPPDSYFIRLSSSMRSSGLFLRHAHKPHPVKKILKSQDAFVMSPQNGSIDAGPGAEALIGLGLDADEYATLAAVDIDRLKEERMRGSERASGYDLDNIPPRRESRTKSGVLWSNYTRSSQHDGHRSSGATDGAQGAEKEAPSALGSERETSVRRESVAISVSAPETPSQQPQSKAIRPSRVSTQLVTPVNPNERVAQWRAEALFDYPGASDDPNELSFKKGEHLDIIDKSGKWWEARTMNGRKGIAPSNYLRLLI